ncbi:MAG TPA: AMP-binding protein [Mycobacterium sp.]|nr:AMP-binding protein [Mycobacterium sp.]
MTFTSPFPDVEIPAIGVHEMLFGDLSETDADAVALVDAKTGTETTYRDLVIRIDAFAGALADRGIAVGDVVGLLSPNSSTFAVAFHGILRAGATATTINALFTRADIAKQLTDAHAKMLITVQALQAVAIEGAERAGLSPAEVIILDGPGEAAPGSGGHPSLDDLLASGADAPTVEFDPATHLAALPYSSGTTGNPKGVMLTHRNLVANIAQIRPVQDVHGHDTVLAVLPFFHIYGMTVLLNAALDARAKLVIMPSFDLAEFLSNIEGHRCTIAFIAPPVAVALAKHPMIDEHDLSSLRIIMSGAAPLDEELGHAVAQRIGARVVQGYGMTELSPVSHCIPFDGGQSLIGRDAPLDSVGWTAPNGVSKIIDPQSRVEITPPAEGRSAPGELWFKGPNVMAGYLGNAEATAETVDSEGFLHTGDLACVDSDGCVYIVDRLKELIKYKGYQVPPAELEALLLTHPAVADAAVVGVVDAASGEEVPKAFVVRQPGDTGAALTADAVMAFVAENVAPYKKIRQVEFIDAIPKSSAGKILRKELRA